MADRSRRGVRRQVSDTTDDVSEPSASESEHDWDAKKPEPSRRGMRNESEKNTLTNGNRRLSASPNSPRSRRADIADNSKQSIKLTMKVAPSKLREVMRVNEVDALQDTLGGGKVIDGPRSRRSGVGARASVRAAPRPSYTEYGESDLEDNEDEETPHPEDEEMNDFDEVGAESEGGTEDDDLEMEDAPLPPPKRQAQIKQPKISLKPPPPAPKNANTTITVNASANASANARARVIAKLLSNVPVKSVEEQEMEDAEEEEDEDGDDEDEDDEDGDDEDEDDEDEDDEEEDDEEESSELSDNEENTNLNKAIVVEEEELLEEDEEGGEEEELEDEEDEEGEEDMEDDSGDETLASGMSTPDPTKFTKRQRARQEDQGRLLALDMAPQQRKFFTDEEKAMKKDEHARKRKELTKRKVNEEKTAALNRLLKPQALKFRGAAPRPETLAAATAAIAASDNEVHEYVDPLYTRWVSTKSGLKLGVPEEWLGKKVGRYFGPPSNGAMVQELD